MIRTTPFVLVLALLSVAVAYGEESQKNASNKAPGKKLDLKYVPDDAVAAAVAHPSRVLAAPGMELLPLEVITVASRKHAGFDPADLEEVLGVIAPPEPGEREPRAGVVLRFSKSVDLADVAAKIFDRGTDIDIAGHKGRSSPSSKNGACVVVDDRTLILAPSVNDLYWILAGKTGNSPLRTLMGDADDSPDAAAFLAVEPLRPLIEPELARAANQIPPPFSGLVRIPQLVDTVEVRMEGSGLTTAGKLTAFVKSPDEQAARDLEGLIRQSLEMARVAFLSQNQQFVDRNGDPDINEAMVRYMSRISDVVVKALQPKREKDMLIFETNLHGSAGTVGVMTALLLPAVQAAREAARRSQSMNNMKQIGLAMHNHADARRNFPGRAITDKDGKPLLSWRVQILPYIEEQALYEQFHLDEPWDSEHNIKLLDKMPAVYQSPNFEDATKTLYLVPVGEGTLFEGTAPVSIRGITDGLSRTVMVVEADPSKAVPWTKPDDLEVSEKNPVAGLGNLRAGGIFNTLFADGHVQVISKDIDPKVLWALFTSAGGEAVQLP